MNLVSQLLKPANVLLGLEAGSKKRLFELAGQALQSTEGVPANEVFESLFSREKLGSTALGHGIAIPHGRIKGLKETACAFVRMKTPIDFDAPDNLPVDLLFILLAPAAASDLHLQILAELAQMFSEKEMRDRLRAAPDAESLSTLIREWTP
ncbi:PTS IIA-like nitrogen-regulatory protein PtsN [Parasulfuritortus cantonensis]|uniref:PTS IIA-like nitrogen-regulatory protein PtsN n=1 Tax=Parasulfuritortus cantonensis TaxID=2528202 RepID=A0A4R1BE83_9PROT|nr:PTS IIA-like nitrogen regulatory protein PtsN [Parasulfuritortus cantonensis]TCJ15411.1 PTS IIA-like nitrogen-regulatory protein PtsN [Parasulfuritortus cantonensis]